MPVPDTIVETVPCSLGSALALAEDWTPGQTITIQWAPPGVHEIRPTLEGVASQVVKLRIDEPLATRLEAARAKMVAAAADGKGADPYFDFNHEDREASGWPVKFYWGGDDPQKGGILCDVRLSAPGEAAIKGQAYRRFSPFVHLRTEPDTAATAKAGAKKLVADAAGHHIIAGFGPNLGGLVNNPAMQSIRAFFSNKCQCLSEEETTDKSETTTMTPEEIQALQDRLTQAEETIKALTDENAQLKAAAQEAEKAAAARMEAEAKEKVAAAAKDGRIPPAEEVQAAWVKTYIADPEGTAKMLAAQKPDPTLTRVAFKQSDGQQQETTTAAAKTGLDKAAEWIAANNKKAAAAEA